MVMDQFGDESEIKEGDELSMAVELVNALLSWPIGDGFHII